MKRWVMALWLLVMLGCAASDDQLAAKGDWYQIGYNDGIAGNLQRSYQTLSQLGSAKHADYERGYLDGVQEYCNPNFAYQMGLSGQYYEGVCEGTEQAHKFRMEWQRGWREYNR